MEIILIILQFVVIFLFFIFKNTAPNYLKKKAENLATLQDIGKITGEVKEVESKFSQKLAQFQTDLDLIKDTHLKLNDEERESLIKLYQSCNKVSLSLSKIEFQPTRNYQAEYLKNQISLIQDKADQLVEIQSNCEVFVKESEIQLGALKFSGLTYEFCNLITKYFEAYLSIIHGNDTLKRDIEIFKRADKKANPHLDLPELIKNNEDKIQEKNSYMDSFMKTTNKDEHKMEIYKEHVLSTVDQYGGRYLVIGGPCDLVEGTSKPKYPMIIEFPGMNQTHHQYNSEEYKPLKALLKEAVEANAVFIHDFKQYAGTTPTGFLKLSYAAPPVI